MKKGIALPLLAVAAVIYLSLHAEFQASTARERLDAAINSEFQEVRPLISADGSTLYFSRRNHPDNLGGTTDFQDIWVSHLVNGEWSLPTNLGAPLNNKKANTLCSITADGKKALVLDSYRKVQTPLAVSLHQFEGWSKPEEIEIAAFANLSSYYDFHHHEDLGVLLMAVDNGRGSGDQDLHVSFLQDDGSYSKPINLGRVVNSREADFAPFLAVDGKTLFFASYGHKGEGGSDLYVTQRLDNSWRKWSRPINLGPGINSPDEENYVSVTGDLRYIYFESYPKGSPQKDIYRSALPLNFMEDPVSTPEASTQPLASEITPIQQELTQEPSAIDHTMQEETRKPAAFTIPYTELPTRQYLEDGQVRAKVLNNLYYEYNSYQLPTSYRVKLTEIAQMMKSRPSLEAYLEGHADSWGPEEANLRISYLRAQSAAHYLIDEGIPGNRLQINGKGEMEPLASNDDEIDGRELNRRVEITLLSSAGVYRVVVLQ